MNQRLSSDNLYHFTQDSNTIIKILETGFRYSLCNESIPDKSIYKNIFNISFCDIKFEDSETHRKCYGNNAIVLSKDWGIKNGISPVRYIHLNSPGLSESYVSIKDHYNLVTFLNTNCNFDLYQSYLITSIMSNDKLIDITKLKSELKSPFFKVNYNKVKTEFSNFRQNIQSQSTNDFNYLNKIIDILITQINDLQRELTERDNFIRIYEDEFECPQTKERKRKILYDEREWRSIYIFDIDKGDPDKQTTDIDKYMQQKYLPSNYNLRFNEDDVIAILTKDDISKELIIEETININRLLSNQFIQDRTFTVKEFNEK